jgi:hypothetical protein
MQGAQPILIQSVLARTQSFRRLLLISCQLEQASSLIEQQMAYGEAFELAAPQRER